MQRGDKYAAYCEKGHKAGAIPWTDDFYWVQELPAPLRYGTEERVWSPFCITCGSPVHELCPSCKTRVLEGANYCGSCGKALPWMELALSAARAAVDEADALSVEEQAALKGTLPDLTSQSARTPLAVSRFSRLVAKAGPAIGPVLLEIVRTVAISEVKQKLGL